MKTRYVLATTSLISALSGTTPALAGPLGMVSGGAGAIGTLGGTVSGFGGNPAIGAGSMIGAGGQFQGAFPSPNLVIDRVPTGRATGVVQSVNERAQTRIQGARDAALEKSVSAAGEAEGAAAATGRPLRGIEATGSARGDASASASGDASTGSASAEASGSAQTQAQVKR